MRHVVTKSDFLARLDPLQRIKRAQEASPSFLWNEKILLDKNLGVSYGIVY